MVAALLCREIAVDSERKISSHSMKSTMLSMLAKRGVSMEDRLVSGYHSSPFKIGLTYCRDGMSRPLMILESMLAEIRKGRFHPDETRSGRLKDVAQPSDLPRDHIPKIEIDSDIKGEWRFVDHVDKTDDTFSSPALDESLLPSSLPPDGVVDLTEVCADTSDSEAEAEEGEIEFEEAGGKVFAIPKAPEGYVLWQRCKSKILHLMPNGRAQIFECGRKAGKFHTKEQVNPRWDTGICWKHF